MCRSRSQFGLSCVLLLGFVTQLAAADDVPLTGAHVLSRLARQPAAFRPPIFHMHKKMTTLQLALVVDGTTSMKRELNELATYLQDLSRLYGHKKLKDVFLAMIVYRDARSPSGPVVLLSDFTNDIEALQKKVAELKPETGEPYFPEAMDQGLHSALTALSWAGPDVKADRRILIIGDAPPYGNEHENRKYPDAELQKLATDGHVTIDAVLVNSGFPQTDDGVLGTSRETATKAAPYAREFLSALSTKTSGAFLDLWNTDQLETLLVPTLVLENLSPLPEPAPTPELTAEAWHNMLANRFASVRGERPALRGVSKLASLKPQSLTTPELFPALWSSAELKSVISDLIESLDEEPGNATIHLLLANLHAMNAAADGVEDHAQAVVEHVKLAYELKSEDLPGAVRDEIDALNELYVNGQRDAALTAFRKVNTNKAEAANPGCHLRAAWACLALEAGFWPATDNDATKSINHDRCRQLVLEIVTQWPDSVESQALKRLIEGAVAGRTEIPKALFLIPRSQ